MTARASEIRPQLPRAIAGLFIGIIALASLAALLAPSFQQRLVTGPTKVGVITKLIDDPTAAGRIGAVAPDFEWVRPNGESTRLSSLRPRPVVLNFWATWCVPCRAELPRLEAAARAHGDITFLEIDLDEDGDKVRGFLDSLEVSHLEPLIDVGTVVAQRYRLSSGVPSTFFVDRDGVIRHLYLGEMDEAKLADGLRRIAP
ncbi:MAG TPA: TlpA disulfide reductase family protein [Candidatus Limnocylindria bacterium]